jgi:hypothetical protein
MKKVFMMMSLVSGFSAGAAVPVKPAARSTEVATQLGEAKTNEAKIKYKSGKDLNFDELLIQGDLKRPELSVVTGNVQPGSDGLLRLRDSFMDRITIDLGEELP